MYYKVGLNWEVGFCKNQEDTPTKRVQAVVPGAVQLDWARAEGWGDYTYAHNYKQYAWMEDVYWSYITKLDVPEVNHGKQLFFVCKGIDYRFKVKLNKETIYVQEGMFTPFEIDLTNRAKLGDELEVLIYPAPKRIDAPVGRAQADQCCKPAVSYGWDWHPRLIPLGIWDETYLEVRPACHIKNAEVLYNLSNELDKVYIDLYTEISEVAEGTIKWTLYDKNNNQIFSMEKELKNKNTGFSYTLENPELWWPNGHGDAVLYTSKIELTDKQGKLLDQRYTRVGFRRVRLVMHQGAWEIPKDFPKSRSNPPITLEINGRQIFCKGTNWVNPEIFPGIITEDTYRPLIKLAKEANMNIFRSWGGGIINKEIFFELCDEYGIMVWQEFPLACNNYNGTPEYLKVLEQESKSIIKRLRSHACLAMWCGGNELFNAWSGMTDQSLALRLLNRNCYDLDPHTPFIMTSPLMGMAHGNYLFRYQSGEEVFQVMPRASNTAYTEFGCPGPSPVEYLKSFIPEDELFPPRLGTTWETHHAFGAWGADRWLELKTLEYYFGAAGTMEELVKQGELLQCEGYKCIFEEARRQKPVCSMALNWCYNEPWPTAANNSLINWPAKPKPSYFSVKSSCRPILASARIPKFSWKEGEMFSPELWILNDMPHSVAGGRVEAFIKFDNEEIFLLAWDYPELQQNTNMAGPIIRYILPYRATRQMKLRIRVQGKTFMDSEYILLYSPAEVKQKNKTRTLNM